MLSIEDHHAHHSETSEPVRGHSASSTSSSAPEDHANLTEICGLARGHSTSSTPSSALQSTSSTEQSQSSRLVGGHCASSTVSSALKSTVSTEQNEGGVSQRTALRSIRPKIVDASQCVRCSNKVGNVFFETGQLCSDCNSQPETTLGADHVRRAPSHLTKRRVRAPSVASPGDYHYHTLHQMTPNEQANITSVAQRVDSGPQDLEQLDSHRYPSIVWYDKAFREFWCFVCGANVNGIKQYTKLPIGQWYNGIKGEIIKQVGIPLFPAYRSLYIRTLADECSLVFQVSNRT